MKNLLSVLILLSFILFGCKEKKGESPYKEGKYSYFYERIAVDEFYRKIIGYDSVEITGKFMDEDKLELNYCYPNQWEREKYKIIGWKKEQVPDSTTGYIKIYAYPKDSTFGFVNSKGDSILVKGDGLFIPLSPDTSYKLIERATSKKKKISREGTKLSYYGIVPPDEYFEVGDSSLFLDEWKFQEWLKSIDSTILTIQKDTAWQ